MAESKRASESFRDTSPNSRSADNNDAIRLRRSQRNAMEQSQQSQGATDDLYSNKLLQDVFGDCARSASPVEGASSIHPSRKQISLSTLETYINESLKEVTNNELKASCRGGDLNATQLTIHKLQIQQAKTEGRLGPAESTFDIITSVGNLLLDPDKLGITSHSNFSSIKGNCCVYEGKWVYELMLVSKGVMQLGWCTSKCRFTQEEGVGDTRDSYAYDGNRLRKWNITTKKYGEPWMSGDVISCAIDCDQGAISFYRNGVFLGEAFDRLRMGPDYAYFPAVSLSFAESIRANFGALPLKYPLEGYRPLQNPRLVEVAQAELLFTYLHSLLPKVVEDEQVTKVQASASNLKDDFPLPPLSDQCPPQVIHTIVASHIFHKLAPLLRIPYVVEMCLVKFMLGLCDHDDWDDHQPYIHKLLDLLWMLMQDQEMQECIDNLTVSLLNGYSFHSFHPEFKFPKKFLALTLSVLKHPRTRRYLLTSVLFERIKFPVFMHIKAPDDPNLARLIPNVWWDKTLKKEEELSEDEDDGELEETATERINRKKFELCCDRLGERILELESIQVELLKCLLVNNDCIDGKTSRDLFLARLKTFLRDHSTFNRPQVAQCSLPVILCFFHRLIQALRFCWDQTSVSSTEAFMPIQCFWNESRDYFELLRCGGLMSHLNRQLSTELNRAQGIEVQEDGKVVKKTKESVSCKSEDDYPKMDPLLGSSLEEILDCVVLLYHIAAHRQLGKMCALRESMLDFVVNLRDTDKKIRKCSAELSEVKEYLEGAKTVFKEKIVEQARQMVWVEKVIYSPSKQADLAWLLGVVLKTVERASQFGRLFQYIPEFYIETAVNAFNALRNYMHPTTSFHGIQGLPNLLSSYSRFLVNHFFDSRLVSNDLKDTLVQALACFTCYPDTLKVLEDMPMENRILMIQSLVSPYENRSWAHTNWILLRIWKGCGFGYRYRYLPNLIPHKAQPTEFSYVSLQRPCPSQEFQSLLAKILLDEEARSTKFLDSLMNQLNWSFSEFVGIIQEISSQGSSRTEPLMLEPRQVKICAACFEISVCLLRVLEMVATVAPQVFTDWSRPSAELFLKRLMQLLSQIMSRVTMKEGPFENTVALPIHGLDTVTFYPILTVTVGIMAQLIVRCGGSSQEKATRSLLLDSGFSLDSLKFVLGKNKAIKTKPERSFNFRRYKEISEEELEDVEKLMSYLSQQQVSLSASEEVVKEDELCTICYANRQQAVFVPCGHRSCRTCITQQLLNKKECFFCIATITKVNDLKGRQILREHFQSSSSHRKS